VKIDSVLIDGKNLLGDSYALTIRLRLFSDLIPPSINKANTNPGDIYLVDVRGSMAIVNSAGIQTTRFTRISLDQITGSGSDSSSYHEYAATFVPSVSQAKNEYYSYVDLVTDPLTGYQIRAIEESRTGDEIRLFILLNFLFRFTELGSGSPVYVNTVALRSDYNTNKFYFAIPFYEWSTIKERMGFPKTIFLEIPEATKPVTDALSYIDAAERAFSNWNTKELYDNCREAGKALDDEVKRKTGSNSFIYVEKWSRAYSNFEKIASLALHVEDLKKSNKYKQEEIVFGKSDSSYLILLTKSLASYASQLIKEAHKNEK